MEDAAKGRLYIPFAASFYVIGKCVLRQKTLRGDRHAAEGNYAAEAARRRRRSPQSGFFLVRSQQISKRDY